MSRTVVGLDLSLTSTGIAYFDPCHENGLHNIKTKGKKSDTLYDRQARLYGIANEVVDTVDGDGADLVVVEAPSFGSKHGAQHDRSGLWWLVVNALRENGYEIAQVPPRTRAKYATGNGNAGKDVVLAHVTERYSHLFEQRIVNDDLADAITLAAMGKRQLGEPVDPTIPERNLEAMDGVLWPVV